MRDARGRSFRLHPRVRPRWLEWRRLPPPGEARWKALAGYAASLLAFGAWMIVAAAVPGSWPFAVTLGVIFVGSALSFAFFVVGVWFTNRDFYEKAARRMDHGPNCSSCWYDLSGQTPEDDGCVVCPECGAAWRMGAGSGVSE